VIAAFALDQNTLYLVLAVLVFLIVIFAIFKGRSVKLWFKNAGLQVGEEAKKPVPSAGTAGISGNVLDHATVDGSNVNVHIGNSVEYLSPDKKEEPPKQ
jgi:hypothetical protein